MKRALLIVLAYIALLQFVAPLLVMIPYAIMQMVQTGSTDSESLQQQIAVPAHLCSGLIVIAASIGYAYYRKEGGRSWKLPKAGILASALLAMATLVLLLQPLLRFLQLSDNSEVVFDRLLGNWIGILAVAVVGPIAEELVFRKHVMHALKPSYSSSLCILISALLFGLIHINPAQVVPAFILGLLLAWVYSRTDNILLTSLMHIANNSVSVVMILFYGNEVEILSPALSGWIRLLAYVGLALLLCGSIAYIYRSTRHVPS